MRPNRDSRLIEFFSKDMSPADAFECLFENAPEAIYILDTLGRFVAFNRKAEELTGFKREDYIGKSFRKIIPAESLSKAIKGFQSVIRGKSIRLELKLETVANKTVLVEVSATPFIKNGKIVGTLGIVRDIAEHKKAEGAIESKRYLETILNSIFSGVVIVDGETHEIVDVNSKALETIGASREQVIGKVCHSFICPAEKGRCPVSDLGQTVDKSERVLLRADGQRIPILKTVTTITWKNHKYLIESLIDITEQKQAENAQQKSEERFTTLMEEAPIGICNTDLKGKITYVNKRFAEATGYSREEIVGKNGFKLGIMSDETLKLFAKRMKERLMGKPSRILEGRFKRKDGELIWAETEGRLIKKFGVPVGFQLTARDVTERKIAEKALRESQEKFERLFMDNPEAAVYVDSDFHILDINSRFSALFGYSLDEIKGKHINDVVVQRDKMEEAEIVDRETLKGCFFYETIRKKRDGSLVPVSISVAPIKVEGKLIGAVGLYRDVTEQKQMQKKLEEYSQQLEALVEKRTTQLKDAQEQILKSERLAAIGQLAAMVGHDLRNPLMGIDGATYYLKTKLGSKMDEKVKEMFELIEKDIEYSNNIITDLLEYSREILLEKMETNPKSITAEALALVKVPESIQVSDLTQSEPKIEVDVERMKRVFVNIIKNAIDAMPEGGRLTIASKKSDDSLEIAFADTGVGISKETLDKLWTPLFTTKAKGMGLGLPICKRFVEAHEGNIFVESKVGRGTTFTVTVPIKPKLEGGEKPWLNQPEYLLSTMTRA